MWSTKLRGGEGEEGIHWHKITETERVPIHWRTCSLYSTLDFLSWKVTGIRECVATFSCSQSRTGLLLVKKIKIKHKGAPLLLFRWCSSEFMPVWLHIKTGLVDPKEGKAASTFLGGQHFYWLLLTRLLSFFLSTFLCHFSEYDSLMKVIHIHIDRWTPFFLFFLSPRQHTG